MITASTNPFATLVIVAAGRGERFGNSSKILEVVGGKPVLLWSLLAAEKTSTIADVIVVAGAHTGLAIRDALGAINWSMPISCVTGGATRHSSVAAGVAAVSGRSEVVLVHDGARPLASPDLFDRCAIEARTCGAAIVAIPVSDTLKRVVGNDILETVSRHDLWAAQTPQGFRREIIASACERSRTDDLEFTDEASLLESFGVPVRIVAGERTNIKITQRDDLELVDALIRARQLSGTGN